jgi:hypothetical protein
VPEVERGREGRGDGICLGGSLVEFFFIARVRCLFADKNRGWEARWCVGVFGVSKKRCPSLSRAIYEAP